jgi:hypothetical protein
MRERLSPSCAKQYELGPGAIQTADENCKQEIRAAATPCFQTQVSSGKQCIQERLSSKCRDQTNKFNAEFEKSRVKCEEAMTQLKRVCPGSGDAFFKCMKEHESEFKLACNGLQCVALMKAHTKHAIGTGLQGDGKVFRIRPHKCHEPINALDSKRRINLMKKTVLLVILFVATFSGCDQKPNPNDAGSATTTPIAQVNTSAASEANIKIFSEPPLADANGESASALNISCDSKVIKCDSLIPLMQSFYAPLHAFEVVGKTEIAPGYMAIVLLGKGQAPDDLNAVDYMKAQSFGVFIIDDAGNHVLTLDIFPTGRMADYDVKLGEHGDGYLVVSGAGSTYGDEARRRKYFFDLKNCKVLLAKSGGIDVRIYDIVEFHGDTYCIGNTDEGNAVIARIPSQPTSPQGIEVLNSIQNEAIETIIDIQKSGDKLLLVGNKFNYVLSNGTWGKTKNATSFAKNSDREIELELEGKKHSLVFGSKVFPTDKAGEAISREGIFDRQGTTEDFYILPQPTYQQFKQFRPSRVGDGYTEDDTKLESEIGPHQLESSRIWFGLKFYDGEGTSGIGGIGSFDVLSKKFELTYPKEIADSSVYSILVEPKSIWVGLGIQPEGAEFGTGIARIDRKDNSVVRYKINGLVNTIARVGKSVYAGSSDGVAVIGDDGRIEHIRFSINKDGGYTPTVSK